MRAQPQALPEPTYVDDMDADDPRPWYTEHQLKAYAAAQRAQPQDRTPALVAETDQMLAQMGDDDPIGRMSLEAHRAKLVAQEIRAFVESLKLPRPYQLRGEDFSVAAIAYGRAFAVQAIEAWNRQQLPPHS